MFEPRRHSLPAHIAAAGALFVAITVARVLVRNPAEAIGVLYVIPVALLAVQRRVVGGVVGALVATGLTLAWGFTERAPISAVGYGSRATAFVAIGLLVGLIVEQRERHERDASRWFSMSNDLLCTASFDGYFTDVNASWERVLGYSRHELLAVRYTDLIHPDDLEATSQVAAGLGDPSVVVDFENRYRARDGSWRWLLWSARSDEQRIYAVAKDVTNRKSAEREREHLLARVTTLARTDDLTGLANRPAWRTRVTEELLRARRSGNPVTVALVDLDRFKLLNDEHGHQAGDRALKECACAWQQVLRETDLLGRLGGDEFAVVLPDCDRAGAAEVVARIVTSTPEPVSASVGVASWDHVEELDALLARADEALYAAKARGRACTVLA